MLSRLVLYLDTKKERRVNSAYYLNLFLVIFLVYPNSAFANTTSKSVHNKRQLVVISDNLASSLASPTTVENAVTLTNSFAPKILWSTKRDFNLTPFEWLGRRIIGAIIELTNREYHQHWVSLLGKKLNLDAKNIMIASSMKTTSFDLPRRIDMALNALENDSEALIVIMVGSDDLCAQSQYLITTQEQYAKNLKTALSYLINNIKPSHAHRNIVFAAPLSSPQFMHSDSILSTTVKTATGRQSCKERHTLNQLTNTFQKIQTSDSQTNQQPTAAIQLVTSFLSLKTQCPLIYTPYNNQQPSGDRSSTPPKELQLQKQNYQNLVSELASHLAFYKKATKDIVNKNPHPSENISLKYIEGTSALKLATSDCYQLSEVTHKQIAELLAQEVQLWGKSP